MPSKNKTLRIDFDRVLAFLAATVLVGIFFFPRFALARNANVRLEDIALVPMTLIIALMLSAGMMKMYPETLFPSVYFAYAFIISLARSLIVPRESVYFLIFWGKELQYYIFFLVFYHLFARGYGDFLFKAAFLSITPNLVAGLYKIITGIRDYYGIGALFLGDAPSLSGQVYLGAALVFLMFAYLGRAKNRAGRTVSSAAAAFSSVCCLATASKSSSFGIISFFVLFAVINDILRPVGLMESFRKPLKWLLLVFAVSVFLYFLINKWHFRFFNVNLGRLRDPIESVTRRYKYDITPKLKKLRSPLDYVFGIGYMAGQLDPEKFYFGSAFDSQYLRNLQVLGIFGSAIWLFMLALFGWALRHDARALIFYLAMLGAYLVMGVGLEAFQLSKSGAIFWILTAMLLGHVQKNRPAQIRVKDSLPPSCGGVSR